MTTTKTSFLLALGLLATTATPAGAQLEKPAFIDALPKSWRLVKHLDLPADQVAGLGRRFGVELVAISNSDFVVGGTAKARINLVEGRTEADADRFERTLIEGGKPALALRVEGRRLVEFVGADFGDFLTALRALDMHRMRHRGIFRVALVEGADGAPGNDAFNLFLRREAAAGPARQALDRRIRAATSGFERTGRLRLFTPDRPGLRVRYVGSTAAAKVERRGEYTTVTYEKPPALAGVPYTDLELVFETSDLPDAHAGRPDEVAASRGATPRWPTKHEAIRRAVSSLPPGGSADRARRLHAWVRGRVRFGGEQMGSRYGVAEVCRQGFGHCWDFSDVLVCALRSAGLPSRQLAGWMAGVSGHVWSEVWLEGAGWVPVDATLPFFGVTARHLPFRASSDGQLSIFYLSMPKITRLAPVKGAPPPRGR